MRLREVFRYELEDRLRRPSTWIYAALLFAGPFLLMYAEQGESFHLNAPASVAEYCLIFGMFGMLISAALFGDAAVRDVQAGMDPLLYTSPIRKAEYLGGRFLAVLAVNAVLLLGIPLGQAAGMLMPHLDADKFGPFAAAAYVQPFLLFLLPNLLLVGAILFAFATLARQIIPAYLGAIGLFVGYLIAANHWGHIDSPVLSALADPLGLGALQDMTRYWTTAERNTRLVGFPAMLLWNRALWLGVAATVLALLHRRFRFAHGDEAGRRRKGRRSIVDPGPERAWPVAVPRVEGTFGLRTRMIQTLAVARRSFADIAASRAFLAILLGGIGIVFLFGWDVGAIVFDTSTWPLTHLVAGTVLTVPVSVIIAMIIALYAGELVWKDREVGAAGIADAAPVPEGVALLGRFLALVAVLAAIQAVFMGAGVLLQAIRGYTRFELGLYLRILFGLNLVDYALLAALAMTVHVVVNQKYFGHMVVVAAFLFTVLAGRLFGIHHHLLVYGTDPGWVYSDMNGFGPFIGPFIWFKLYWAAWALLLAVVANVSWVRGQEPGLRHRLAEARVRLAGPVARTAAAAVVLVFVLGGFIFYNTNVLNDYRTPEEAGRPRAEYERRYERFEDAPQPVIAGVELRVEIYPEEPAVDLGGTYRLVNRTGEAIDSIHVSIAPEVRERSISFDRGAERVLEDEELNYRIFALERPLEPGDSLRLAFDVTFRPRGFPNSGVPTEVVGNGAYFDRGWLPVIGYQETLELSGEEARKRFGLEPQPPLPSPDDAEARRLRFDLHDADYVDFEAIVGTAADQIAVTPGVLRRSWTEGGRRYFHYETEVPISFGIPILSAKYAVLEDRWNDVPLRIFHHPTHTFNLDRMVRSMKASLDYFSEAFGPYPYRQLRIVEFPRYASFARAHPHTIAFSEGSSFLSRIEEGDVDRPYFVTAHEIAHQWWGNQVRGAMVKGVAFLSETMAQYGAMLVLEKTYGPEMVRRFYDHEMSYYLSGRASGSREVPLLEVEDQSYIYYHKGALAMYTLRERIGEERVNTALRRFLDKHRDGAPPYATSLDLYAELRAVTPDSLRYLLRDLFEEITLWDVETERASFEPTGTGEYRVTIEVRATKLRADSIGIETEVPMDDLVEVGVFAPAADGDGLGEPLYLEWRRIRSGEQTITVIVPEEPAHAGIDPFKKLIQRRGYDNVVSVEAATAEPVGRRR